MILFLKSTLIHLKSALEYKNSFILGFIGSFLTTFLSIISIKFLFDKFMGIEGWEFYEVALTFGMAMFCHAFTEMIGRGLDHFADMIKIGSFDRVLVRPRSLMLQVACNEFEIAKLRTINFKHNDTYICSYKYKYRMGYI